MNNGAELSYKLVNGVGETVDGTSFTVGPNSQFDLFIEQSSSYMAGEEVISHTPLAWVMITSPDLTVVEKAEDLLVFDHEDDVKNPNDEAKTDKTDNACYDFAFFKSCNHTQKPSCERNDCKN